MTAARRALDKAFFDMLACVIEANVVEEAETKPVAERMAEVKARVTNRNRELNRLTVVLCHHCSYLLT